MVVVMAASASEASNMTVASALRGLFITADESGPDLRLEDRQKVAEVTALLGELHDLLRSKRRGEPGVLVDAASGKAPVGLLAAQLLLATAPRPWTVHAIDQAPDRMAAFAAAAERIASDNVTLRGVEAAVDDPAAWPPSADVVVALHACGAASDAVIERVCALRARWLLLVPCCYGAGLGARKPAERASSLVPAQRLVEPWAERLGLPARGLTGRRFAQSLIDAERTLRLEAAGYLVDVVELVAPTVTPFNLLWRARLSDEPTRKARAVSQLACLRDPPRRGS